MTTLVLGPSLGTSAAACWGPTVSLLRDEFDVVAWELPGHGQDRSVAAPELLVEDLAAAVLASVDGPFVYAGDSVGGAVGLQLLLDAPDRVLGAVLCCTAAKIADRATWDARIAQVGASGTASLVTVSASRWFADGFVEQHPDRASALLHSLRDADDAGYAAVCHALAEFDVRARLQEIERPVVAVAGSEDPICTPDQLREIAESVVDGELVVLDGVAHQAPAEAPHVVAAVIRDLAEVVTKEPVA